MYHYKLLLSVYSICFLSLAHHVHINYINYTTQSTREIFFNHIGHYQNTYNSTLELVHMAYNAYLPINDSRWLNTTLDQIIPIVSNTLKGYIFYNQHVNVIALKGTSIYGRSFTDNTYNLNSINSLDNMYTFNTSVSYNDKYNDNLMMSCCFYKQSHIFNKDIQQYCLHTDNHTESNECCIDCYKQSLYFESNYIKYAQEFIQSIQDDPIIDFKNKPTIFTGHSLGGFIATILGILYDKTVVTFQAPGEKHYIYNTELAAHLTPQKLQKIYHLQHNSDSIINGHCGITCSYAGYHINTHCHIGNICEYDSKSKLNLAESIWNHRMPFILKNIIPLWEEDYPTCTTHTNCTECTDWIFT